MDIINKVGKGVVGVSKAAGHGVVGVSKGVVGGVGHVGKTAGHGVFGVSKAASKGVGNVGKGVGKGVVGVGKVAGKTASAAAGAGVSAGNAAAAAVGEMGMRAVGGHHHQIKGVVAKVDELYLYCSDFYTDEFILGELEKIRNDNRIVRLYVEDLIVRESPEIIKAFTQVLLDTTGDPEEESMDASAHASMDSSAHSNMDTSIRGTSRKVRACSSTDASMDSSMRSISKRVRGPRSFKWKSDQKNNPRRTYKSIVFTDCVSSSLDYLSYLEGKEAFYNDFLGHEQIRANVPSKFKAKVELQTMMSGQEVKEMLQEIEADTTITGVDFPLYTRELKKIPRLFMENFDAKTGEWKEEAMSIEIQLRYANQDNLGEKMVEESGFAERRKSPTKVVSACLWKLEGKSAADFPNRATSKDSTRKCRVKKCLSDGPEVSRAGRLKAASHNESATRPKKKPIRKTVSMPMTMDGGNPTKSIPKASLKKTVTTGASDAGPGDARIRVARTGRLNKAVSSDETTRPEKKPLRKTISMPAKDDSSNTPKNIPRGVLKKAVSVDGNPTTNAKIIPKTVLKKAVSVGSSDTKRDETETPIPEEEDLSRNTDTSADEFELDSSHKIRVSPV